MWASYDDSGFAGSMTTREATACSGADSSAGKFALSPTPRAYFAAEAIGAATRRTPARTARLRTTARRRAGERIGERSFGSGAGTGLRTVSAGGRRILSVERAGAPEVTAVGAGARTRSRRPGPARRRANARTLPTVPGAG